MRERSNRTTAALEVSAVYSVAALARTAGVTRWLLTRLLRSNGVTLLRAGDSLMVPLSEIEHHIPPLWRSIIAAERIRRDARDAEDEERGRRK
jgi:hypothetical protein